MTLKNTTATVIYLFDKPNVYLYNAIENLPAYQMR